MRPGHKFIVIILEPLNNIAGGVFSQLTPGYSGKDLTGERPQFSLDNPQARFGSMSF
jgi:hypothetical protein